MNIEESREVLEEVESITCTLPGKVFYAEDGEVLILADEGKYIISVSPNNTEFNNGNPVTSSAYLITQPLADLVNSHSERTAEDPTEEDIGELEGWTSGWEC